MYKITLKDGTIIDNLTKNGDNFVSSTEVKEDTFTADRLASVTVTDTDSSEAQTYDDIKAAQVQKWPDGYYIAFGHKSEAEKQEEKITALELAFTELLEGSNA